YTELLGQIRGIEIFAPGLDQALLVEFVNGHHRMRHRFAAGHGIVVALGHDHVIRRHDLADRAFVVGDVAHLPFDLAPERLAPPNDGPARHPQLPDGVLGHYRNDPVELRARFGRAVAPGVEEFADKRFLSYAHVCFPGKVMTSPAGGRVTLRDRRVPPAPSAWYNSCHRRLA